MSDQCQMCGKDLPSDEELDNLDGQVPIFDFCPSSYQTCSFDCQAKAIRVAGAWRLREKLRNIASIPYETFQEIFQFPEAGGYAENMYQRMRMNPWTFLYTLDRSNFIKLMLHKG